jgi:hypothetical protein
MPAFKPFILIATLCLGLAGTVSAFAATIPTEQWYTVEILVFRYTGPDAAQGELWPRTVAAPTLENAVYPPAGTQPNYLILNASSPLTSEAWQRLSSTAGYDPLLEIGWMQPGYDTDSTRPVSLEPIAPPAATTATAAMTTLAPVALSAALPAVQVQGTATLAIAANKPYIQLDLRLCEPPPPGLMLQAPTPDTAPVPATTATSMSPVALSVPIAAAAAMPTVSRQCFALHESHKVTPGQMEYFDTAAFGVLALVRPVTTTPATTTAAKPQAGNTPD